MVTWPVVFDQLFGFQNARRQRHATAPGTEHHAEKFLGEQEFLRLYAVMRHQKPTAAALLDGMEMIACRHLRGLIEHRVDIAQHDLAHHAAALKRVREQLRAHT